MTSKETSSVQLNADLELVEVSDGDEGGGAPYYFLRHPGSGSQSQRFATRDEAITAFATGEMTFALGPYPDRIARGSPLLDVHLAILGQAIGHPLGGLFVAGGQERFGIDVTEDANTVHPERELEHV